LVKALDFVADIVMLDVVMPGMPGVETFLKLRKIDGYKKTPCVLMTANTDKSEVEIYKKMGAMGVIGLTL